MNAGVRTAAKKNMQKKTGKLFLVSLLALFLRLLLTGASAFIVYALSTPRIQSYISSLGISAALAYLVYLAFAVLILFMLQTAAGLKLGESEYYGICASGGRAKLRTVFSHCTPRRALKALTLYITITVFKIIWFAVMLMPCAGMAAVTYLLYYNSGLSLRVFYILSVSVVLLLITGVLCWYMSIQKYVFAPFISARSSEFSPRPAIRRSIAVFDCCALSPVGIKIGLIVPLMTCALVIPAIYALPYIRISMAALFAESKKNAKLITCRADEKPVIIHTKWSYN